MMARRGDKLREHILWVAKDVFLELGFERASMDEVASRAETSKRSLYAHFKSKEALYLAVIELVRGLFLDRLKMPGDYADKPAEALVAFCSRYLRTLLYESSVQMCRVSLAETARFPDGAAQHFDVMFTEVHGRLCTYLKSTFGASQRVCADAAQTFLGQVLYPRLLRALFGLDPLGQNPDDKDVLSDADTKLIRRAVTDLIDSLQDS